MPRRRGSSDTVQPSTLTLSLRFVGSATYRLASSFAISPSYPRSITCAHCVQAVAVVRRSNRGTLASYCWWLVDGPSILPSPTKGLYGYCRESNDCLSEATS
jgi:hypothetical protein